MNRVAFVVYDEYLGSAGTTATDLTRIDLYHPLALFDRLAIEVLVHDALTSMTTPAITVQIFHSGNGRGWVAKNATPEINAKRITLGGPIRSSGTTTARCRISPWCASP